MVGSPVNTSHMKIQSSAVIMAGSQGNTSHMKIQSSTVIMAGSQGNTSHKTSTIIDARHQS